MFVIKIMHLRESCEDTQPGAETLGSYFPQAHLGIGQAIVLAPFSKLDCCPLTLTCPTEHMMVGVRCSKNALTGLCSQALSVGPQLTNFGPAKRVGG